uniref:U1-type domain-containing protein n=1 Tax=Chlamydomonas leiostraca TaxID=1034604 RepID=A0A7S0S4L1_9CHLO|eukprot:CAMPEP_0202871674 /NCGR_PEP_ID=MMETSP1391-20130828/19376_1 /ASSEMBLY_ACC=CAM_ASM_000867 /TAXON_ID=1034604 /ORGANISM="Chlamydomonas leiostraca, Strain SAG 11-49" /LENGTH=226 /DNA_ID=CAMNT_0049552553 /DNA_START=50 /DNA_END=730 /DNA_ORIENTATION=+
MSLVPKKPAAGVDNTARRTWDKDEFREKAREREKQEEDKDGEGPMDARKRKRLERDPLHQGMIVERSQLKQRDYQIDLAARLGKTQVVGLNMPLSQQAGYYCSVCDCILRDSQSYLDHINGKWHNRALGMTMRVERSTVDQVRKKLEEVKEAKKAGNKDEDYLPDGIDKRILEAQQAEEREREERKQRKLEKKAKEREKEREEEADGMDPDMMALMGFGGFGGGKK